MDIVAGGSEGEIDRDDAAGGKKAAELFEKGILDNLPAGKFSTLQVIHKYLFEDIYDFAGELRTVNIAKGNFRFAPLMYLQAALENIDKMPQSNFDEIVEKYVEMNIAHPFREGNGRSTRIWLDHILKNEIGKVVDWSKVDKEDYLLAMERSPIKDIEIKHLLKAALTDEVDSRDVCLAKVVEVGGEGSSAFFLQHSAQSDLCLSCMKHLLPVNLFARLVDLDGVFLLVFLNESLCLLVRNLLPVFH